MQKIIYLSQEFENFVEDKEYRSKFYSSQRKRRHQKGLKLSKELDQDDQDASTEIPQNLTLSQDLSERKVEQCFALTNSLNLNEYKSFEIQYQNSKKAEKHLLKRQDQNKSFLNQNNEKDKTTNSQEIEQEAKRRRQLYYQQFEAQDQSSHIFTRGLRLYRHNHHEDGFSDDIDMFGRPFKYDFGMQFKEIEQLPETKHNLSNQNKYTQCQICLQNIEQGQKQTYLFCFHGFHSKCIRHWLINNVSCPLCKMNIKEQMKKVKEIYEKKHE